MRCRQEVETAALAHLSGSRPLWLALNFLNIADKLIRRNEGISLTLFVHYL